MKPLRRPPWSMTRPPDTAELLRYARLTGPAGPAPPAAESGFRRGLAMARAVFGPRLDEFQAAQRLAVCAACPAYDGGFCKECGCGRQPLARLDRKAKMMRATCPRGLWPHIGAPTDGH